MNTPSPERPATKKRVRRSAKKQLSFEDALGQLEQVVQRLEGGELGLSESLEQYEQGVKHLKHCYAQLEDAERRVQLLQKVDENGDAVTTEFDEAELSLEQKAAARSRRRTAKTAARKTAKEPSDSASTVDDLPGLF